MAFHRKKLPASQLKEMEAHVMRCQDCSNLLQDVRAFCQSDEPTKNTATLDTMALKPKVYGQLLWRQLVLLPLFLSSQLQTFLNSWTLYKRLNRTLRLGMPFLSLFLVSAMSYLVFSLNPAAPASLSLPITTVSAPLDEQLNKHISNFNWSINPHKKEMMVMHVDPGKMNVYPVGQQHLVDMPQRY